MSRALLRHAPRDTCGVAGACDDRCVLVATLGCSLVLASVLVTTGVWGSRQRLCGRLAAKQGKDKPASEDSCFSEIEDYK